MTDFQEWRTPKAIFNALSNQAGGYDIDLFADGHNHLCDQFFTEEDDAYSQAWHGICFGNPPYKKPQMPRALDKALEQVGNGNCKRVDLLMLASTSAKWFERATRVCEVKLFCGRIVFDLPPNMVNERRPLNANALFIVRPGGPVGITGFLDGFTGLPLSSPA